MPSPRRFLLVSLAALAIGGLSFADGPVPPVAPAPPVAPGSPLPPPPPPAPPATPPDPALLPPVVAPAPSVAADPNAAKAVLDRRAHDFGTAKQGAELKADFTLKNEGKSTLTLQLRADCGCAAAIADVKSLEPNASTTIHVTYLTRDYVGPLVKRIHVLSNDPVDPRLEISLRVDVAEGVVLDPAFLYFGYVEAGSSPSKSIKVQWKDGVGTPFEIASSEVSGLDMALTSKRFDADAWHGYEVTATFRKPPAIGTWSGTAILKLGSADGRRITIPVSAFVSGKVFLDRREVSLGLLPQGKERTVMIGCRGLRPEIDIGVVTAKSRNGRVVVRAIRAQDKEWLIEIQAPETATVGRLDDVVEVTSSTIPETAEIVVKGEVLAKKD